MWVDSPPAVSPPFSLTLAEEQDCGALALGNGVPHAQPPHTGSIPLTGSLMFGTLQGIRCCCLHLLRIGDPAGDSLLLSPYPACAHSTRLVSHGVLSLPSVASGEFIQGLISQHLVAQMMLEGSFDGGPAAYTLWSF